MTEPNPASRILTKDWLLRRAGERYYQRGLDYFERGKVTEFEDLGDCAEALVKGTEDYEVQLRLTPDDMEHDCDCPLGMDEEFCKHCVAVALKWIDARKSDANSTPAKSSRRTDATLITEADLLHALEAEGKEELVRRIIAWAQDNDQLREKLIQMAARRKGPGAALALARKSLEKTIRVRRFLEYREMPSYAASVETAAEMLEDLLKDGQAAGVMELSEMGLRLLGSATEHVDDSDGYIGGLMERFGDLHLRACIAAKPDPAVLAAKLFRAEMESSFDEWDSSVARYTEVLGADGLAAYRALAEAAWAKLPVKTQSNYSHDSNRYRITAIMENLARRSGNVEELVAVLERDLSHAHQYLRIATIYREAGDRDKALAWAEKGSAATSGSHGADLRLFVAEEYQFRERHADALRIVWIEFRDSPSLASYKRLEQFARAADDWEEWREQALACVRRKSTENEAKPANTRAFRFDLIGGRWGRSLLVEILLYENRVEEAWQEAQAGSCNEDLWLRLSEAREKQHPEDAMRVYLRVGEQVAIRSTGNYDDAVHLLERAATAARSAEKSGEFEAELEALLKKYRLKRNLLKRVEQRKSHLIRQAEKQVGAGALQSQ
jgi:uncharacterized Zn finger protein